MQKNETSNRAIRLFEKLSILNIKPLLIWPDAGATALAKREAPKIKGNIDARESRIRKDIEEANSLKEEADKKLEEANNKD